MPDTEKLKTLTSAICACEGNNERAVEYAPSGVALAYISGPGQISWTWSPVSGVAVRGTYVTAQHRKHEMPDKKASVLKGSLKEWEAEADHAYQHGEMNRQWQCVIEMEMIKTELKQDCSCGSGYQFGECQNCE
jgi:hypothetical protein